MDSTQLTKVLQYIKLYFMKKEILAKRSPDVTLEEHSFSVCDMAIKLCEISKCNDDITALCGIAALFHDIGKCVDDFQNYIVNGAEKKI